MFYLPRFVWVIGAWLGVDRGHALADEFGCCSSRVGLLFEQSPTWLV